MHKRYICVQRLFGFPYMIYKNWVTTLLHFQIGFLPEIECSEYSLHPLLSICRLILASLGYIRIRNAIHTRLLWSISYQHDLFIKYVHELNTNYISSYHIGTKWKQQLTLKCCDHIASIRVLNLLSHLFLELCIWWNEISGLRFILTKLGIFSLMLRNAIDQSLFSTCTSHADYLDYCQIFKSFQ